jgi:hypothetical protein
MIFVKGFIMEIYVGQHSAAYYNQILNADRKAKVKRNQKNVSFTSQEVHISDYLYSPDDWESVFYTLYFTFIPYLTGATFLFFAVAGADYANFKLMDMSAFLIVWIIGYEIVATSILLLIFMSYLRFRKNL